MADLDMNTGKMKVQDAILPSFYPEVISSTPFLVSLFDIPVTLCGEDTDALTLSEYIYPSANATPGGILSLA